MALVTGKLSRVKISDKFIQDEVSYQYTESDDSQDATSKDDGYSISTSESSSVRLSMLVNTVAKTPDHMTYGELWDLKANKTEVDFEWGSELPGASRFAARCTLSGWDETAGAEDGAMQVSLTANLQGTPTRTTNP